MKSPSLVGRALAAVALLIGFYLFAIAVIVALLYIIYAEFVILRRVNLQLTLIAGIGAIAIAISIIPRPDRFQPPGPRLQPKDHPELFTELNRTARAVGQAMPAEVYLVPDVNAWVAQRGGVMGLGSRRVMGLGLPLLQIMKVSELRAVIAHEFGHFYGGDTKLGPWIYKTRGAIIRTLQSLQGVSELLQSLFLAYAKLFLRVTHAISRQQEYSADALAVRTVGADPLISGLKVTHSAGAAFIPYWTQEVLPVLNAGFRPPLADGFARFVHAPNVATQIEKVLEQASQQTADDPYDTHPPLRDRIAAVEKLPRVSVPLDDRPARVLLKNVPELESELLMTLSNAKEKKPLQPIAWSDVSRRVYLPNYEKTLREHSEVLAGITPRALPEIVSERQSFTNYLERNAIYLERKTKKVPSREGTSGFTSTMIGAALALALHQHGWAIDASPGAPVTMQRGDEKIDTFSVVLRLLSGELTADTWRAQCERADIADLDLGKIPLSAAP